MERAIPATILRMTIKGKPVQWARTRVGYHAKADGGTPQQSFHNPPEQKRFKGLVKDEGRLAMLTMKARRVHNGKPAPLGTPVIFEALVYLPIPAGWKPDQVEQARRGLIRPTGKPDLDNWLKLPMDGLEGIAYANDSQVVGFGRSGVWYADKPRLEVHVYHAPPGLPDDPTPEVRLLCRLWAEGAVSEGQLAKALDLDRIAVRKLCDEYAHERPDQ